MCFIYLRQSRHSSVALDSEHTRTVNCSKSMEGDLHHQPRAKS